MLSILSDDECFLFSDDDIIIIFLLGGDLWILLKICQKIRDLLDRQIW